MFNSRFRIGSVIFPENLPAWISVIIYLFSLQETALSSRFDDITGLGVPRVTEHINSNTICGNADGLSRKQYDMCIKNPEAVASAIQGLQIALHECKRQFKDHRWDCTSLETRNKIPYSSKFFHTGFREAAYFQALSSAGVSYAVAHACSLGKIPGCECLAKRHANDAVNYINQELTRNGGDESRLDQTAVKYSWGTCNHDINFAMKFSRRFLDERQSSKDFYTRLMLHNNRVGRLIVANNMRRKCSCHGTSGSCSMRTCWQETPTMQMVGGTLKRFYTNAAKIPHDNRVQQNSLQVENSLRPIGNEVPRGIRRSRSRALGKRYGIGILSLVYWNTSPEYCASDPSINFFGTKGRFCNREGNSKKIGSCANLCCNRGYRTYRQARMEQCECRFHWCCRVECNNCTVVEKMSVCR